nr:hypothetical protein [Tanacetum cinerariifolium]
MFKKPQAAEIYDLVDALHSYKHAPRKSMSAHVLEMNGYMDQLHALGKSYDNDMAINLISRSLNKDFGDFVRNFNMHYVEKTMTELHTLLIDYEKGLKDKAPTPQGFKEERKLSYGEQYLQLDNGAQAAVEAIGVFDSVLPSGLVLKLKNCYYAPSIVRGVVSLSCLLDLGFNHTIDSNGISISLNGLFYISAVSVNDVIEIDMNNNVSKNNNNSIFSINKKRKLDLDYSYLWHYRLAHIGKTRMQKLQCEGLLESINDESFDKCESCISGKITKKPFNNNIERATDILGLIHTDVCGLLRHVSKKGASYFLTFTDDFSRYGYVYLLKHKHEKLSGRDNDLEDDHMDTLPSKNTSEILVESESLGSPPELILVHRSERTTCAPNHLCLNKEVKDDEVGDIGEPAKYKAAMLDPDKVIWQGAMDEEINSIKVMKVWIVVDLPPNANVVRSEWLYKKKTNMDGKVHTYKARLVAKGCTKTYKIDYEETFSPVADIRAIRILIAISAYYDYEIWQMDVKTTFLNGRLDEDIYMEQPEGCVDPKYPNRVCKLQRSIYGLKQASHQWNKRFDEEIKIFGFIQNHDEPRVYRKASGSDVILLILYDLGEAAYILGIKIYRDRSRRLIGLSQSAYIDKILKKYNMHNSKKGYLPMEVKHDLSNELCASTTEEVAYMKKVPYASAVGSIMYAVRYTRPDVAFSQNLVSRYQHKPGKLHWVAVKDILKYLRNTRDMFLVYEGKPNTKLDVIVDWKSKKQTTIAMHSAQAEYVAASEATMEAVWIRKFVRDLGVMPSINKPINMYCDNYGTIIFANEPGTMKGGRHFLWRYHYVREQVETGEIK